MVLAGLKEMLSLIGIIDIHCSLVVNTKKGYTDIIVGTAKIASVSTSTKDMKLLIAKASFVEVDGQAYLRNPEKNGAWQHKQAIDYAIAGGENTYATYGDSCILNRDLITIIY